MFLGKNDGATDVHIWLFIKRHLTVIKNWCQDNESEIFW